MERSYIGGIVTVFQGKAFDSPDKSRLENVVQTESPATESHAAEKCRIGIHCVVQDGRSRLVIIADPCFVGALFSFIQLSVDEGGDKSRFRLAVPVRLMTSPGVEPFQPGRQIRPYLIRSAPQEDALPVIPRTGLPRIDSVSR